MGWKHVALGVGLAAALTIDAAVASAEDRPIYLDPRQPMETRVEDVLSRLTLEEKVGLIHGDGMFATAGVPRLGIPRCWMSDGPHGVREEIAPDSWKAAGRTDDFATHLPALIALASSWNPDLAISYGEVIGQEARQRGKHIMLGPGMNIMRTPLNGRNFEYEGEDPFLAARMVVGYIRGVQSQEVAACAKHFAANNQETARGTIDVQMDERSLREIYLPAFKAAVQEAGVLAVMGAYNKFRGQHCCHNDYLLNKVLKGEWGFKGLVMSDWSGTHDTREAALFGLDLEMGTRRPYDGFFLARPFREGLEKGDFPMAALDDKVRRNLRVLFAVHAIEGRTPGSINTPEHQATARRVAEEGMVLLKNEAGALPLDPDKVETIAVIGENAVRLQAPGGGSAGVKAFYEVTPLQGIVKRVGDRVSVGFSMGYQENGHADLLDRAVRAASQADAAVLVVGLKHARFLDDEGSDRRDLKLPFGQDELIQRVARVNKRTIVVLISGGPVDVSPWLPQVPAVLQLWYPGMEGGNALARVLFGDVNPSGKLPCTFPKRLEDSPAHALGVYPGKDGTERYEEGLLVGYRWFDTKQVEPLFPFGHGLSYTRFQYSGLKLVKGLERVKGVELAKEEAAKEPVVSVEFDLKNVGDREGAEVAQVYVQDVESSLPRPVKELKGLQKVLLKAGESRTVSIPLDRGAFAFYDPAKTGWLAEKGDFKILVGSSSRDVRLEGTFRLAQTTLER